MKKLLILLIPFLIGCETPTIQIDSYYRVNENFGQGKSGGCCDGELVSRDTIEVEPMYLDDYKYDTVWYDRYVVE
jgi:hypothetical protein